MGKRLPVEGYRLSGKRIVFLLPPHNFHDEEYKIPRMLFEREDAHVVVASSAPPPAEGMFGTLVTQDIFIKDLNARYFDALLLVGGVGSNVYWHDRTVHNLVRASHGSGKLVGAICLAPVTLANAGLLTNKRATAYASAGSYLAWKGAIYTGNPIEIDGGLVTANGPEAAEEFARTIASLLGGVSPR